MSWNNRVVWSEGMFLRPQHLQQHDRYMEALIDGRCRPLSAGGWGFSELRIDESLLSQGKVAIVSARGVLPDGTPFDIPGDDLPPPPLNVNDNLRDAQVFLGLPLKRAGSRDTVGRARHRAVRAISARCGKCAMTTPPSRAGHRWRSAAKPCAC